MDVPYNSSGASSAAHYALVRNVENSKSSQHAEQLLVAEKERVRRRLMAKTLTPAELRKELIILLYCLNTSSGSLTLESLQFALPFAVHLAEAGSRASEKYAGYLFCAEVMSAEHELALMLVNTIRKDLTSPSIARMDIALNMLISFPSMDVIPAVQARVVELISHPSPRIKVLALNAYLSLSRLSPDMLQDGTFVQSVISRLEDGEESVTRAALETCLQLVSDGILNRKPIIDHCAKLINRFTEKNSARRGIYSASFRLSVLSIFRSLIRNDVDRSAELPVNMSGLCASVLAIIRRAVRDNEQSLILEAFRLLGQIPASVVSEYLTKVEAHFQVAHAESKDSGSEQQASVGSRSNEYHPVARIRHFLSSQSLTEHYLFLSCLVALDASLWAGSPGAANEASNSDTSLSSVTTSVLDQWEVERIMGFLESDDVGIRSLTIKLLSSQSGLLEICYARAVEALRKSSASSADGHGRARALESSIELAFAVSSTSSKSPEREAETVVKMLKEIAEVSNDKGDDYVDGNFIQHVLVRLRGEKPDKQRAFLASLFQALLPDRVEDLDVTRSTLESPNTSLLLTFLALLCELGPLFQSGVNASDGADASTQIALEILVRLAKLAEKAAAAIQEPIVLCLSRLALLLPQRSLQGDIQDGEHHASIEKAKASISSVCDEASRRLPNKMCAKVVKRCEQFIDICRNPRVAQAALEVHENCSLPEFAILLDGHGSTNIDKPASPIVQPASPGPSLPSSPPRRLTALRASPTLGPTRLSSSSPLSQSKLRYAAYEPPSIPSTRFGREHRGGGGSGASLSSRRSSSRMSNLSLDKEAQASHLADTVTPGELALVANMEEMTIGANRRGREVRHAWDNASSSSNQPKPVLDKAKKNTELNLIALDSPFLSDPFVNPPSPTSGPANGPDYTGDPAPLMGSTLSKGATSSQPSPYVSANTSLRTTPEPDNGHSFEAFWNTFAPDSGGISARGWCEDLVENAVRRLQALPGVRMDVISGELGPFIGDLKIYIRSQDTGTGAASSVPCALVRLHEEDDGSFLWQARGNDASYLGNVKGVLS